MMRRNGAGACLAAVLLVLGAAGQPALVIAPPPVGQRVATSDLVVVGQVSGIAGKLEPAEAFKGDARKMQIATLKVDEALLGKPGKEVKVGFFPPTVMKAKG